MQGPISLSKLACLILAVPNRVYKFVHEPLKRKIGDLKGGSSGFDRVSGCLNQMGLAEADSPVKIERIVCLARQISNGLGRSVSKTVARRDDEILESVFFVQWRGRSVNE